MSKEPKEPLAPRVEKLEEHVGKLETEVEDQDKRMDAITGRVGDTETQVGRIGSHLESESALARKDIGRIEHRLFGDEDDEYGGRLGQMAKKFHRMEVWFLAVIAAGVILSFLFETYQFLRGLIK